MSQILDTHFLLKMHHLWSDFLFFSRVQVGVVQVDVVPQRHVVAAGVVVVAGEVSIWG